MDIPDTKNWGQYLCYLRRKAGLSQKTVAELISRKPNTISAWENQRTKPGKEIIPKLQELYNADLSFLYNIRLEFKEASEGEVLKEIASLKVMMEQVLSSFEMRPSELEGRDEE
ncbi:helix-turn-helix transcriptional regulator [bacterium]|nr:helix-turn-helix transcriptional regulator [bacterium]